MSLNYLKRSEANSAKKLILDSDEGEEYFLMVNSMYSDEYRVNRSAVYQKAAESSEIKESNKQMLHAKLLAAAIVNWSVPKEYGKCTPENAEKLLFDFPQIADAVDIFISDDSQFIEKKSKA